MTRELSDYLKQLSAQEFIYVLEGTIEAVDQRLSLNFKGLKFLYIKFQALSLKLSEYLPVEIVKSSQPGTTGWPTEWFEHIVMAKTLNFNYHIDPSDLLSDKAFIPSRTEWTYEYDVRCAQNLYPGWRHQTDKSTNRVLVKYLTKYDTDVEKVLNEIEQGSLSNEDKVMVAIAKEREFKKLDARCFAKMTFNMRLYQTATESNIAESIFPLIKYQSMTMDEVTLLKTISQMCESQMCNRKNRYVYYSRFLEMVFDSDLGVGDEGF